MLVSGFALWENLRADIANPHLLSSGEGSRVGVTRKHRHSYAHVLELSDDANCLLSHRIGKCDAPFQFIIDRK